MFRRTSVGFAAIAIVGSFSLAACGSGSSSVSPGATPKTASLCGGDKGSGKVVVAAAKFGENETLAAIYAAALNECGYTATTRTFTSREVYYPLVKKGEIQVVPEYAATLTDYINALAKGPNAPSIASGDITKTVATLKGELPSSLAVLQPAAATDKNAFAVTKAFATKNHITTLSELATYSKTHSLVLGGPAECNTRTFCEPGLKSTYGFKFSSFKQLGDAGGPLSIKAIQSGSVSLGLVFTSDPTVEAHGLVVLDDDKDLQASDNIIPLVQSQYATGAAANALNAVDSKLDQDTLIDLNKAVDDSRGTPTQVASQFLSQEGLS